MLVVVVTAAQAEVRSGSFSFTPFIGGYGFEGNENLKNTYTAGLRAGYNFTENLGVEGFFNYVPTEVKNAVDADIKLYGYGVEGIYHFMPEGHFVPFLAIGIGGIYYSTPADWPGPEMNKFAVDYGAGLKFFLTDDIALRADVRHVLPLNDRYNDLLVTFGITYSFGGEKKQIAEAKVEAPPAPKVPEVKVEEPPAPKVPEVKVEEPPAPKVPEVKVEEPPAPPAPKYVAPTVVEKKQERVSFILKVQFAKDKSVIKKKYHKYIKKLADFMKAHPETSIEIIGHTDNASKKGYNILLSQKRADSLRRYLISKFRIRASRVHALGYGANRPIASNKTKLGRQKNQRIEVVIYGLQVE